jgi:hypothetical protein
MAVLLNADTGAVSGISGLTTTADNSGILQFQSSGTATLEISTTGNITIPGTGKRILGDFSNGTIANRALFQTSTTDSLTLVTSIPNGTSQISGFAAFNSSTPTNASWADLRVTDTIVALRSNTVGTGTYLPMTFYTGGSETARFSATAKTLILAGGNTSATGTGIAFPATQSASSDANTLDDYEEGTWTPGVALGGGSAGQTYAYQTGTYTKIGRLVTVNCVFNITNNGSSTGNATLSGLPFSISSDGTGNFMGDGWTGTFAQIGVIFGGSGCFFAAQLGGTGSAAGWANTNQTNFSGGGKYVSFSYYTS